MGSFKKYARHFLVTAFSAAALLSCVDKKAPADKNAIVADTVKTVPVPATQDTVDAVTVITPVAVDTPQVQKSTPVLLGPNEKAVKVVFKKVKDTAVLVKRHPFLHDLVTAAYADTREALEADTLDVDAVTLSTSRVLKLRNNTRLMFVQVEGPLYRGTLGTPIDVFINRGKGFDLALSLVTHADIKVVDGKVPALIVPDGEGGYARWSFDVVQGSFVPATTQDKNVAKKPDALKF